MEIFFKVKGVTLYMWGFNADDPHYPYCYVI